MHVIRKQVGRDVSLCDALKAWRRLLQLFAKTLQLPADLCELVQERAPLVKYLSACRLIVDCKNAAMRVSRSVWEDLCQRMFNPLEPFTSGSA